jgi:hypothetical protein
MKSIRSTSGQKQTLHYKKSAMPRCLAFMLFLVVAVSSELPAQIIDETGHSTKPVNELAQCEFGLPDCEHNSSIGTVSGTWAVNGGTFNSTWTTTAIATIDSYRPENDFSQPPTEVGGKFWYRARMLNQSSGSSTRVGIVYHYQDPGNFFEVSFSPTGSVFVRDVSNGVSRNVATGTYSGGGQNKWFDVEVQRAVAETIIRVNGLPVVRGIRDGRTSGRVGLITRQTTARFDRLLVMREYGDPEFRESFSGGAPSWDVIRGNWSVVNGVYQNSAIEYGSITTLPFFVGMDSHRQTQWFTVHARMLNPYGASGNRMGFVHSFQGSSYEEIVFGADGIARANRVVTTVDPDGKTTLTVTPLERAPYPFVRNQWFDVTLTADHLASSGSNLDHSLNVSVNGTPVFNGLEAFELRGPVGLVTNWTPGRFDDVWFCHNSCGGGLSTESFVDNDEPNIPRNWAPVRGTWDTEGDVLNNRSAGASDIVSTFWRHGSTDYTLSARMLNPYGASGNRVGLIFNFDFTGGDYYEVEFATTGQAYINKFIQGERTQVATATHSAGRNVWFNVELTRHGPNATVKVNNQIVFENVPVAQLDHSFISTVGWDPHVGVKSRFAPGRFDDLQVQSILGR